MKTKNLALVSMGLCLGTAILAFGESPSDSPRPIPTTRPELKQLIEDVKVRVPRIPLPEPTAAELEKLGTQGSSYESRLRSLYLSGIDDGRGGRSSQPSSQSDKGSRGPEAPRTGASGFGREQDPLMTLDNAFKVELFWIVSRINNCQYCLGHQESKLLGAGLSEDQIASLDGDWTTHEPEKQVAFAFAKKFTFTPQLLNDSDIAALRKHYSELQILEMVLSMAGNNSINRWKEGAGVPQSKDEGGYSRMARLNPANADAAAGDSNRPSGTYLTPTSPAYANVVSRVAPIVFNPSNGLPTKVTVCRRPALESRQQSEELLEQARHRSPRINLETEEKTRELVGEIWPKEQPLANYAKLLSRFPVTGMSRIRAIRSADEKGDLSPLLKAQVAWIVARQDRAWYAIGTAQMKLQRLGQTPEQIYTLDSDWDAFSPRERSLFTVAKNLGASPVVLTDSEVATAVEQAGPRDVVQLISYTTNLASFNRITESVGLPLEN